MLCTWFFTVGTSMWSRHAICLFDNPWRSTRRPRPRARSGGLPRTPPRASVRGRRACAGAWPRSSGSTRPRRGRRPPRRPRCPRRILAGHVAAGPGLGTGDDVALDSGTRARYLAVSGAVSTTVRTIARPPGMTMSTSRIAGRSRRTAARASRPPSPPCRAPRDRSDRAGASRCSPAAAGCPPRRGFPLRRRDSGPTAQHQPRWSSAPRLRLAASPRRLMRASARSPSAVNRRGAIGALVKLLIGTKVSELEHTVERRIRSGAGAAR